MKSNYNKWWKEKYGWECKFYDSKEGIEIQLCLISQGYESFLACRYLPMFGSGFVALQIIQSLKEEYLN